MEKRSASRLSVRGIEVNTMAMLDASGFIKVSQDLSDDRNAFLQAVRSASIVPQNGIAPTRKMFEAIFRILKDENSLELVMASYQLLYELDKYFPRVYASKLDVSSLTSPSHDSELVVAEEGFHLLIQDLVKLVKETKFEELEPKSLRNMLLLQYLISVLEGDFMPRNSMYRENMNWNLLKESLLNKLLGSRKINYRGLIKDFLSILFEMSHAPYETNHDLGLRESLADELLKYCDYAIAISFPLVKKYTSVALQKFLLMGMELDTSRKKADMLGLTMRSDGLRIPVAEIIQDEFTYNRDSISPFFQVFNEPKWKLQIVVQYFQKYISKPPIRTRRSGEPTEDAELKEILKIFSNANSAKSVTKKITIEVAQLLLAHAFQAYLSLAFQDLAEGISCSKEDVRDKSLVEICRGLVSAFTNLRKVYKDTEILPSGNEAVFTAATILSKKS